MSHTSLYVCFSFIMNQLSDQLLFSHESLSPVYGWINVLRAFDI